MRARKIVEEPTYPPPSDDGMKAVIGIVLDRDRPAILKERRGNFFAGGFHESTET